MERHRIRLRMEIVETPLMVTDRNKVLQILLNLLRNAKDAVLASANPAHEIWVRLSALDTGFLRLEIADNGIGIPPENITRIFSHGFTTKPDGHGFGLHFGALTANQLGGSLRAFSEGQERGATFTLELPIDRRGTNPNRSML
jgi:signal transduction histidine kinase